MTSLASLTVEGIGAIYNDETDIYSATVAHGVTSVAIKAITRERNASVAIGSHVAQTGTGQRQISIGTGANEVAITVTATDGVTVKTHNLVVTRESTSGVCGRTQQVRDQLVAETGATDCGSVTAEQLAGITSLDLNDKGITTLKGHDFFGLTSLTNLHLRNNKLTLDSFPAGFFSRLPLSIRTIEIDGNPGCPTAGGSCFSPTAVLAIAAKAGAKARNNLVFRSLEQVSLAVTGDYVDPLGRTLKYQWSQTNPPIAAISTSDDDRVAFFVAPSVSSDTSAEFSFTITPSSGRWAKLILNHFWQPATLSAALTISAGDRPLNGTLESVDLVEGTSGQFHYNFDLRLSEPVRISYLDMRDHAFSVVNGTVLNAKRLSRTRWHNRQRGMFSDHWQITVRPNAPDKIVTVLLAANRDCTERGAICTTDGKPLSNAPILALGKSAETLSVSIADTVANVSDRDMCFDIALSRASEDWVVVQFELTMEGSAEVPGVPAGERYFQRFSPGTLKEQACVPLPAISDDDNGRTVIVRLASADRIEDVSRYTNREVPIPITDAEAIGIVNASGNTNRVDSLPLASFEGVPEHHDGSSAFTLDLRFTAEPPGLTSSTLTDGLIEVTGGSLEGARPKTEGSTRDWEVRVTPSQKGNVVLRLPARGCGETNAICINGLPLAREATATVPWQWMTASFGEMPTEHDGSNAFTFELHFSEHIAGLSYKTVGGPLLDVTGARVTGARRLTKGSNQGWLVAVTPDGSGDVSISLPVRACGEAAAICAANSRPLEAAVSATVPGPAALSVADADVDEAEGATLDFAVTLSRARTAATTVDYATGNGTATAGSDYTAASGTLTFAAGDISKTVSVTVLDDALDEGSETLMLTLSNPNPSSVRLADGEATGTIRNTDKMPKAWIARFGRTVADHVLDAVEARQGAVPAPGMEASLAGQPIGGTAMPENAAERPEFARGVGLSDWLTVQTGPHRQNLGSRTISERDLLTGSSFAVTAATKGSGMVSIWGRGAVSRFDGREGDLTVDGEVASGMLGADWSEGAWKTGLLVSHSMGNGDYRGASAGTVTSTLTGIFPWTNHALSERLSVWGVAGYGEGSLTLEPEERPKIRTDLDLWMAAVGLRGVLVDGGQDGPTLAAKTDAMVVRTSSDAVSGGIGNLAAAEAEVTRVRLGLEGSQPFRLADGATLTPSVEIGVRQDGGDAETGFGVDIGGGLAWSDTARGISAEFRGRGLLTHDADGFRERGLSGSLSWDPQPGSDRGPRASLIQTLGGPASGGMNALLSRDTLTGLAANDNGRDLEQRRLEARFGYGFATLGDRFTSVPELAVGLSDAGRDYSLGWRLVRGGGALCDGALELSVEALRRETANQDIAPEHRVGFRINARF